MTDLFIMVWKLHFMNIQKNVWYFLLLFDNIFFNICWKFEDPVNMTIIWCLRIFFKTINSNFLSYYIRSIHIVQIMAKTLFKMSNFKKKGPPPWRNFVDGRQPAGGGTKPYRLSILINVVPLVDYWPSENILTSIFFSSKW